MVLPPSLVALPWRQLRELDFKPRIHLTHSDLEVISQVACTSMRSNNTSLNSQEMDVSSLFARLHLDIFKLTVCIVNASLFARHRSCTIFKFTVCTVHPELSNWNPNAFTRVLPTSEVLSIPWSIKVRFAERYRAGHCATTSRKWQRSNSTRPFATSFACTYRRARRLQAQISCILSSNPSS